MTRFRRGRFIESEWLDDAPPAESAASLRDLVRINKVFGGHNVLRGMLARVAPRSGEFSLLDVGAASGDNGRTVRKSWPRAAVTSLDYRVHHLQQAAPPRVAADAFHLPFRPLSFDYVFCSLFLHHFSDDHVVSLLSSFRVIARQAVLVSDLERHALPFYTLPATRWLFGWHALTLHDGPISVQAAFRPAELGNLAARAGLPNADVRRHRPAFRLSMIACR